MPISLLLGSSPFAVVRTVFGLKQFALERHASLQFQGFKGPNTLVGRVDDGVMVHALASEDRALLNLSSAFNALDSALCNVAAWNLCSQRLRLGSIFSHWRLGAFQLQSTPPCLC